MDKQFPEGIYWNDKHEKAPSFIKGSISIKVEKAIPWLREKVNNGGYVNITVKESRAGKVYLELDTWEKKEKDTSTLTSVQPDIVYPEDDITPEDTPF